MHTCHPLQIQQKQPSGKGEAPAPVQTPQASAAPTSSSTSADRLVVAPASPAKRWDNWPAQSAPPVPEPAPEPKHIWQGAIELARQPRQLSDLEYLG